MSEAKYEPISMVIQDGEVVVTNPWPEVIAIMPELLGASDGKVLTTEIRFTAANGSAQYKVTGYNYDLKALEARLEASE